MSCVDKRCVSHELGALMTCATGNEIAEAVSDSATNVGLEMMES